MRSASRENVENVIGCDHASFVSIGPLVGELLQFQHFAIWRPSAILNLDFVILHHTRSQLCGSITLSKSGVDPIFPAGYCILWFYNFASLAGKCLTTPPFWIFLGVWTHWNCGSSFKPPKAHPWVTTRHLSHKWLKSVQGVDMGAVARKKV